MYVSQVRGDHFAESVHGNDGRYRLVLCARNNAQEPTRLVLKSIATMYSSLRMTTNLLQLLRLDCRRPVAPVILSFDLHNQFLHLLGLSLPLLFAHLGLFHEEL